jgi:hypothetical protein
MARAHLRGPGHQTTERQRPLGCQYNGSVEALRGNPVKPLLLLHNLARLGHYDIRGAAINRDFPRDTDRRILIFGLRRSELGAVATPN